VRDESVEMEKRVSTWKSKKMFFDKENSFEFELQVHYFIRESFFQISQHYSVGKIAKKTV